MTYAEQYAIETALLVSVVGFNSVRWGAEGILYFAGQERFVISTPEYGFRTGRWTAHRVFPPWNYRSYPDFATMLRALRQPSVRKLFGLDE